MWSIIATRNRISSSVISQNMSCVAVIERSLITYWGIYWNYGCISRYFALYPLFQSMEFLTLKPLLQKF